MGKMKNLMKQVLLLGLFTLLTTQWVEARIVNRPVNYSDGDKQLKGWLYYDDAIKGARPGVIVVHEWWGITDYIKQRAEQLAGLGYAALVADIYGEGFVTSNFQEAGKISQSFIQDQNLLRKRANLALAAIRQQPEVDKNKIAAIGYCFGGTTVLELARSGADLKGVVSFHGGLSTVNPADAKNIKASVLVCHGAKDKFVSPDDMNTFINSMNEAGVDYELIFYSNSVHGFTNPANGNNPETGLAYNEKADLRSWQAMKNFLKEIFK